MNLKTGDQVELSYEDSPETTFRGTVSRLLSDSDEGLGPEVQDYIASWLEIVVEGPDNSKTNQVVVLGTDLRCIVDGRQVILHKIDGA